MSRYRLEQEIDAQYKEIKRLEHIIRIAGQMLVECIEYEGMCKDTMVNILLCRAGQLILTSKE